MADETVEYVEGRRAAVRFDSKLCIHARHCVLHQPEVFKANAEGPWIDPDAASPDALLEVAHNCPSGAITIVRPDGGEAETASKVNLVILRENGPLAFRAELHIGDQPVRYRATLCRCGQAVLRRGSHGDWICRDRRAGGGGEPAARRAYWTGDGHAASWRAARGLRQRRNRFWRRPNDRPLDQGLSLQMR
jgi:uncharacterized Fe-S cluster protein YjdI